MWLQHTSAKSRYGWPLQCMDRTVTCKLSWIAKVKDVNCFFKDHVWFVLKTKLLLWNVPCNVWFCAKRRDRNDEEKKGFEETCAYIGTLRVWTVRRLHCTLQCREQLSTGTSLHWRPLTDVWVSQSAFLEFQCKRPRKYKCWISGATILPLNLEQFRPS